MKKSNKSNILKLLLSAYMVIILTLLPSASFATLNSFTNINISPSITFATTQEKKLKDVKFTITFKDTTGIKNLRIYKKSSNGEFDEEVSYKVASKETNKSNLTTEIVCELSKTNIGLNKQGDSIIYKIISNDMQNAELIRYVRLTVAKKDGKVFYNFITSPRYLNDFKYEDNNLVFTLRDYEHLKYVTILDCNNKNKEIYHNTSFSTSFNDYVIKVPFSTMTPSSTNTCVLKIIAKDNTDLPASTKLIAFTLPENSASNTVNSSPVKQLNGEKITLPAGDKIYFLDVTDHSNGRPENYYKGADAIIIESNGKFGMIDTGIENLAYRVKDALNDLGIKELEFVLITHMHLDHFGGYETVANNVKIKNLFIKESTNPLYNKITNIAKEQGTTINLVNKGKNKITLGNMNFKLYNCNVHSAEATANNENINSITALATFKNNNKKIYFAADIMNYGNDKAESKAAKSVGKVDVYKAAHHSYSNPNNPQDAINSLKPTYCVVTNAKDRPGTKVAHDRIDNYVKENNFKYTAYGTVILNVTSSGGISFQQLKEQK